MQVVIFLDFHSTKHGHWLILGHVALTKIKYPAQDIRMEENGVTEGGKNTASFLFRE